MPTTATGPTRPDVADLVRRAHAELTTRGWHQHDFMSSAGCLCLLGALRRAAGAHPDEEPADTRVLHAYRDAEDELARPLRTPGEPSATAGAFDVLAAWNDHPSRTAAQVLAHLVEVAADLDPHHPTQDAPSRRPA